LGYLLLVYGYCPVRADERTELAAGASVIVQDFGGAVAFIVDMRADTNDTFGAKALA